MDLPQTKKNHELMKLYSIFVAVIAVAAMALGTPALAAMTRPNFLVIVADDLGFSDIGAFGGEIDTPNLDEIAMSGVRLTGFHTAPTCSPTRAMLLSGTDNHLAGLGAMIELIATNQRGRPGYEGYLRPDVATLADRLSANGYRTLLSGKWHLGVAPEQDPSVRGFQHSFTMLQGSHNHFGVADPARGVIYRRDGVTLTSLPDGFYSSDAFATELIDQIKSTHEGPDGGKPFFAYLPFSAPHYPLQAPSETIAKYKGHYDRGYDRLREQRLKRQVELGLLDPAVIAHPPVKGPSWDSLSAEEKAFEARRMEIYAAMVDRLDMNVGRVVAELKASGEYDNTVILFLSDNGAEGTDSVTSPSATMKARRERADNSFEAMGGARSFLSYGPGWAQAASPPSWLYKGSTSEGGTRVVAFLAGKGIGKPGSIQPVFTSVMDVVPTVLELAGVPSAGDTFNGRSVQPVRGRSWLPLLRGEAQRIYPPDQPVGTHIFNSRALRQGDWKIIDDIGDDTWMLFNIAQDPGETRDLSVQEQERRAALLKAYDAYASEVGLIMPEPRIPPR